MTHHVTDDLNDMARAAFAVIRAEGEATRKMISTQVGVSLPSVTNVMNDLEARELVHKVRKDQGPRGRSTLVYGISPRAGWALGIDIGTTQVTLEARGLDGTRRDRVGHGVHGDDPSSAARIAAETATSLVESVSDAGPLRAVALGVNQIVPKDFEHGSVEITSGSDQRSDPGAPVAGPSGAGALETGTLETGDRADRAEYTAPSPARRITAAFVAAARLPAEVPLLVENNVNCAAVAEHRHGVLQGGDDIAYLQIGVHIGLGYFLDGALRRGGSGASGEVARIPLSWWSEVHAPLGELERYLGSPGLLRSAAAVWPEDSAAPRTPEELFRLAADGQEPARTVVARHAVAIARLAAAGTAVIDPAVLALGGGLSQNAYFVRLVEEEFHRHNKRTELVPSTRGQAATVEGAAILAEDLALTRLLGDRYSPLLPQPALWTP